MQRRLFQPINIVSRNMAALQCSLTIY